MKQQKFAKLIGLLIVVAAIPITVFVAQKQQEVRQRAQVKTQSGTASVYFQAAGTTTPVDLTKNLNLNPEQSTSLDLYIDATSTKVNGFDITVAWGGYMSLQDVTAGAGATSFGVELIPLPDQRNGNLAQRIHFSRINRDAGVTGKLHMLSITLIAGTPPSYANGQITIDGIVTSPDSEGSVASPQSPIKYVIFDRSSISVTPPDQGCKDPKGCGTTPTPTNTPTPRATGTPTPTPRTSITPTGSISITPTPSGGDQTGKHTRFDFYLTLLAIGAPIGGNPDPKHKERQLKIEVFDTSRGEPILTKIGTLSYNSPVGNFEALVDMGDTLKTGDYAIKVKSDKYLRKIIPPGIQHITAGVTNNIWTTSLIVGDINNDNALNIEDYNLYVSCFGDRAKDKNICKDPDAVDLNDDGKTDTAADLTDYRWLFDSFKVQFGD